MRCIEESSCGSGQVPATAALHLYDTRQTDAATLLAVARCEADNGAAWNVVGVRGCGGIATVGCC